MGREDQNDGVMKAAVYVHGVLAGVLERTRDRGYLFRYEDGYFAEASKPAVSLTLPKTRQVHVSAHLFAFFQGLLAEGVNKDIQCRLLNIDARDDFRRLIATAGEDTIGAVTVKPLAV